MQFGKIKGIDKPVSRLMQGSAGESPDKLIELFDLAFERGINTFDSAFVYGEASEKAFGKWVNDRGIRDQVVIVAKGCHHNAERKRVTPDDMNSDMMTTMERMGFDHLDAYVLHRDDPEYPVGPIVEAFNEHAATGHIGAFGGSNWSHQRIAEANKYAADHELSPLSISSPNISLAVQVQPPWANCVSISGDSDSKSYYSANKDTLAVVSWSSLAGGFFSGRFNSENGEEMLEHGSYFDKLVVNCYYSDQNFERLARAKTVGDKRGLTVAQIALAYIMHQDLNLFPIMFCRNASEFDQNIAAIELEFEPSELAYLNLVTDTI